MMSESDDVRADLFSRIKHVAVCRFEIEAKSNNLTAVETGRYLNDKISQLIDPYKESSTDELFKLLEDQTFILERLESKAKENSCYRGRSREYFFAFSDDDCSDGCEHNSALST